MSKFKIVFFRPVIPGNTGSIGRTCVGLDVELILIKPYGFDISEKAVRRAGLDYWQHVQLKEYDSWDHLLQKESPAASELFFFSKKSQKYYFEAPYTKNCYLIFGAEVKGLPQYLFDRYPNQFYTVPTYNNYIRSYNLSNVATAVAFEALRQIEFS